MAKMRKRPAPKASISSNGLAGGHVPWTPGEWKAEASASSSPWGTGWKIEADCYSVAFVPNYNGFAENGVNARLIEVAPKLLALLQSLVRMAEDEIIPMCHELDDARDVIAHVTSIEPANNQIQRP